MQYINNTELQKYTGYRNILEKRYLWLSQKASNQSLVLALDPAMLVIDRSRGSRKFESERKHLTLTSFYFKPFIAYIGFWKLRDIASGSKN